MRKSLGPGFRRDDGSYALPEGKVIKAVALAESTRQIG